MLRQVGLTRTPLWVSVSPVKAPFLQQAIDDMLHKGAIAVVCHPSSPGFYSRIFLVPKKNGKMRPVFDLSALNVYLHVLRFKMLTTRQVTLILSKGDWVASLDLADAYVHIPICPISRKYLRFAYQDVVYEFHSLPFGIATAPYVFTRVSCQLSKFLQPFGIPLHMYINDWLTQALSAFLTALRIRLIMLLARAFGWIINLLISELVPTQAMIFVGVRFQLALGLMFPPQERFLKICQKVHHVLTTPSIHLQE